MTIRHLRIIVLVLGICACGILLRLDRWPLKGSDEPRYAQVSREMLETGRYILPHINGQPYSDKPPLYFWLAALCGRFSGDVTPWAARFPSALAGLGMVLLTFLFGRLLFDRETGVLAAGILFTTEEFLSCATTARLDTLFSFWITLSLYLLYQGCAGAQPRRTLCLLGWVSMACAVLTKGPVGLVLPLLTMILYLVLTKNTKNIPRLSIGTGMLLTAGLCCLWLVPACLQGGSDYARDILFTQSFGRVVESFAHKAPFYFYLGSFPVDFLPWTLFLPAAALYYRRFGIKQNVILFPLAWLAVVFIFFSCLSGKRNLYLLPIYPAAALLMAKFWRDLIFNEAVRERVIRWKIFTVPSFLTGCLFVCAGTMMIAGANYLLLLEPIVAGSAVAGVIILAAGFSLVRAQWRRGEWTGTVGVMIAGCSVLSLVWFGWIKPVLESERPERTFCTKILKTLQPQDPLYASFEPEFFNYFLHRYPIPVERDMARIERLIMSPEPSYFLVKDRDFDRLPDEFRERLTVIAQADIGHKTIYFLSNRPPS